MKKLILLLVTVLFISCSTDNNPIQDDSTLSIPERFQGDWISPANYHATITNNTLIIETPYDGTVVRTKGVITHDSDAILKVDLENGEQLILLFRINYPNIYEDDVIGITLAKGNGVAMINTFYNRE